MAESKDNVVTHGLSGKVGNLLVFRQKGGKTIVAKKPRNSGHPSAQQLAVRERFQQATLYAKSVMADPAAKADYEAEAGENKSGYNVAIADFFNAPDISEVNLTGYQGNVGDKILVSVHDDFKVIGVSVEIRNADGSLVEEGDALPENGKWVFTATVANASLSGDKITITAVDRPDNMTTSEQTLS